MSDVRGKTVMITGASRGLGSALAVEFAAAGARVSACARDERGLWALREKLPASVRECLVERVDVTEEAAVARWVERTLGAFGTPDVLINNASLLGPRVRLVDYPLPQWRSVLEANLTGTLIVSQAVIPAMVARAEGSIINVTSGAAIPPRADWGAYAVSKSALDAFSLNLECEVRDHGVRVNLVDPGAMRTTMRAAAYPDEDPGTLKPPESIAPLFLWLASDSSAGVSGERFRADDWLDRSR